MTHEPTSAGLPANKALSALARDAAYDLNNLAAVILGTASEMRRLCADQPELARHLGRIEDSSEKVSHLAERLLGIIQGKARPPRSVNLNPLVSHALQFEEQECQGKLRVKRYVDPDLWPIMADPSQLATVVLHLTLNAYEAAGADGRVHILTQNIAIDDEAALPLRLKPGRYVLLSVEDNGEGLSPEALSRAFEPGFSPNGDGRDNGLALAYRIVKDHKGFIAIRSEPGIGTTLDVYWPAADTAAEAAAAESPRGALTGAETILAIDDEPMMLEVVRQSLSTLGYTVLCAQDGRQALDIAEAHGGPIHLALLDMAMPIMGGAETYPLLLKVRPDIKIIIMSGYDLGTLAQALEGAGVSGVLQKPFRVEKLAATIRHALDESTPMAISTS